ncbi:CRISPR-associated endonuclease Cas2 [Arsenicibacter rosenii]|uniref:CRISPR-associated endoribonuclease Cas2 n=1 Tax=Arsenicibacter rosenii TaxID=1750698 RepID=A0A1S2VHZ6_9BACT|nr:CRISPR-associated endonuclease Cas2 [Arsenicibacter rosenii]OIN58030.1 CRISPR-associated endonuclease Cas2 [Arsenicibacter rosenii]
MIIWVLYDIVKDRSRTKAAKCCQQAGLYRVQFSCFLGTLTPNQKDTLRLQLEDLIDEETDKVYLFPMSRGELQQTDLLGQAFDKKLVTDEIRALFF